MKLLSGMPSRFCFWTVVVLLAPRASADVLSDRDNWLMLLARGSVPPNANWPALNASENTAFMAKSRNWLEHALQRGCAGHLQWGQAIPTIVYADETRSMPAAYDDIGDTTAWTGQLLAALVHKYAADVAAGETVSAAALLPTVNSILSSVDFASGHCTPTVGYLPRAWALPVSNTSSATAAAWQAWRRYFTPAPPLLNGSGLHGVYNCTEDSQTHAYAGSAKERWMWQGGSSRDTYIGALFGLGSTLLALAHQPAPAAIQARQTAQRVFERIFDKLASDDFFIVPPRNCVPGNAKQCLPVNPTPTFIAAWQRIALSMNPSKYDAKVRIKYNIVLSLAMKTESVTKIGASAYYGNNLLSMLWYLIGRCERIGAGARDSINTDHWPKVQATVLRLLADYRTHLQANLPAYWVALANDTALDAGPWHTMTRALLWDFHGAPDVAHAVDQHNNSKYGPAVKCSESCGCSTYAMLVRDRPPNEFVWQITPTKLAAGGSDVGHPKTQFGGAFLAPYWVWRTAGLF